jgi:hypothetical protein
MMSTMDKDALARQIACGEYVVDVHAVAEAMLRRSGGLASPVLVALQSLDGPTVAVEQDEAVSGADVA